LTWGKVQGAGFKGCDVKCKAPGLRGPGAGYSEMDTGSLVQGAGSQLRGSRSKAAGARNEVPDAV